MTPFKAAATWTMVLILSTARGGLREGVIRRRFRELASHQLSRISGILVILLAVCLAGRRWPFDSPAHAWRTGLAWLAATIAVESFFGRFVLGHPRSRHFHDSAIWDGRLWMAVLVSILCAPIISRSLPDLSHDAKHKLQ